MSYKLETYVRGKNEASATFEIVIHGEGLGKFNVRKVFSEQAKKQVYSVCSASTSLLRYQEFLESVPKGLEDLFNLGAVELGFYEGELTIQFPESFSETLNQEDLQKIAGLAAQGMPSLVERYVDYNDDLVPLSSQSYAGLIAIIIMIAISSLSLLYGFRIVPIEWLSLSAVIFGIQFLLALFLLAIFPAIREINKIILFSLFGANSILLTLLIGFFSLQFCSNQPIPKEGAIELLFTGQRMDHLMRIRLAEDKYKSYLIPKHLLNNNPEYLPRAAIFYMREGLFGTRYIDTVSLL